MNTIVPLLLALSLLAPKAPIEVPEIGEIPEASDLDVKSIINDAIFLTNRIIDFTVETTTKIKLSKVGHTFAINLSIPVSFAVEADDILSAINIIKQDPLVPKNVDEVIGDIFTSEASCIDKTKKTMVALKRPLPSTTRAQYLCAIEAGKMLYTSLVLAQKKMSSVMEGFGLRSVSIQTWSNGNIKKIIVKLSPSQKYQRVWRAVSCAFLVLNKHGAVISLEDAQFKLGLLISNPFFSLAGPGSDTPDAIELRCRVP